MSTAQARQLRLIWYGPWKGDKVVVLVEKPNGSRDTVVVPEAMLVRFKR